MSDYTEIRQQDLVIWADKRGQSGEIRISAFGGGPHGYELVFHFTPEGAELNAWNPHTGRWEELARRVLSMEGYENRPPYRMREEYRTAEDMRRGKP